MSRRVARRRWLAGCATLPLVRFSGSDVIAGPLSSGLPGLQSWCISTAGPAISIFWT